MLSQYRLSNSTLTILGWVLSGSEAGELMLLAPIVVTCVLSNQRYELAILLPSYSFSVYLRKLCLDAPTAVL
jgi:hypothetical protein